MAQVTRVDKKELDIEELVNTYNSPEDMQRIEAGMDKFENGAAEVADFIGEEFPGYFTEPEQYALAAEVYARE